MMYWVLRIGEGHAVQCGDRTGVKSNTALKQYRSPSLTPRLAMHASHDCLAHSPWQRSELEKLKGTHYISNKHTKQYIQVILLRAPTWFVQRFG
jgi:hypothetical protein